jgi:hypothetical protein
MSRLTSAQIIGQGHYLEPDFEPSSLTVSQLLGVLGYHNIVYPSPYSKPKLIALFNTEIKPQAKKFKKQRLLAESSIASDDGITDGHTGEPLGGTRKVRGCGFQLYARRPHFFCYSGASGATLVKTALSRTIRGTGARSVAGPPRSCIFLLYNTRRALMCTMQPKRRRSSAQPNLGGPSRKVEPVEPALVEESEPEEEEVPIRKVGRSKKTVRLARFAFCL